MALDDDNGQSVLFVAGHNHFIHFHTYESEVYHFVSDVQTLSPVSVYYAELSY